MIARRSLEALTHSTQERMKKSESGLKTSEGSKMLASDIVRQVHADCDRGRDSVDLRIVIESALCYPAIYLVTSTRDCSEMNGWIEEKQE